MEKTNQTGRILADLDLTDDFPASIPDEDVHEATLKYLESRLEEGRVNRPAFLQRLARIDKTVSTWQMLDEEDSKRQTKQQATGNAQAVHMNLPLITTHVEDMTSFYANIYSPASGSFYQLPENQEEAAVGAKLVGKLNSDAEASKYYRNLTRTLRTMLKYNIGGIAVQWANEDISVIDQLPDGMNHTTAIDMYNFMWDPEIRDPSDIPREAEWAAEFFHKTRRWLQRRELSTMFAGVERALPEDMTNGNAATYYRHPPAEAGVLAEDSVQSTGTSVNWDSYGASLGNDSAIDITGHEITHMYCWLMPKQLGLEVSDGEDKSKYQLWQFYIVDMKAIVYAQPVKYTNAEDDTQYEIPFYLTYMNQDEMSSQQRSTAELMTGFQNFGSFLLNSHVSGTRSSIWGLQGYDPTMFDMAGIPSGATVARIPSKIPGRDVRSGLTDLRGVVDTSQTMQSLNNLLSIMQQFFPAQALPSQIAGMDRAVTSQVSAVMQGANRRMHMLVRILDSDMMMAMSQAQYRNIVHNSNESYTGINDAQARAILGTGLIQLNREQAEQAFRQLLFAVMQNPETAQDMDILAMVAFWGKLLNIPVPVEGFKKQAPVQPGQPGDPNAQGTQPPQGAAPIA